jgi:hypothetical protein
LPHPHCLASPNSNYPAKPGVEQLNPDGISPNAGTREQKAPSFPAQFNLPLLTCDFYTPAPNRQMWKSQVPSSPQRLHQRSTQSNRHPTRETRHEYPTDAPLPQTIPVCILRRRGRDPAFFGSRGSSTSAAQRIATISPSHLPLAHQRKPGKRNWKHLSSANRGPHVSGPHVSGPHVSTASCRRRSAQLAASHRRRADQQPNPSPIQRSPELRPQRTPADKLQQSTTRLPARIN